MQKLQKFQLDDFWLVAFAASLWGTIGVATQAIYNVDATGPLFINFSRSLIASPLLLMFCWFILGKAMFKIRRLDFLIMAVSGTFLALSQVSYFAGILYTGVNITTLLTISLTPVLVALMSIALRLETLNTRISLALFFALIGSLLLVGIDTTGAVGTNMLLGSMLSLSAAAFYAAVIICGRFLANHYHPLQISAIGFTTGTLVLLIVNVASGIAPVRTPEGWLLILYLGLIPTALAYWFFQTGLRSVTATTASIMSILEPLVATLLAWFLFGESLTISGLIGAGLLLISLFLSAWRPKSRKLVFKHA